MGIQMIVTDLDRTLLRTDKSISDYTAEVLNRRRVRGVKIVFATARYYRQVLEFTGKVPADAVVAFNGAVIYAGGEVAAAHAIPEGTKRGILRELHAAGIKMAAEAADAVYTDRHAPGGDKILWDFADDVPAAVHRISVRHHDPAQVLRIAGKYPDLRVYANSGENLLDIDPAEAEKSRGVLTVAERFGIPLSDVAAFGDDFNDVEMLRRCGLGVAVANACAEAKAAAGAVCGSNDEDGVAKWIERHII